MENDAKKIKRVPIESERNEANNEDVSSIFSFVLSRRIISILLKSMLRKMRLTIVETFQALARITLELLLKAGEDGK